MIRVATAVDEDAGGAVRIAVEGGRGELRAQSCRRASDRAHRGVAASSIRNSRSRRLMGQKK